jgi:hypothetical protein
MTRPATNSARRKGTVRCAIYIGAMNVLFPRAHKLKVRGPANRLGGRRFGRGRLQFSVSIADNLKGLHRP